MFEYFRIHYPALFLALCIGLITCVPQFIAVWSLGDAFAGIYPINNDDELYYQARAMDVLDGHPLLANSYLYEYKNGHPMQFWLPDYVLASGARIIGLDVQEGYMLFDCVLPILLAVGTYATAFLLTRSTTSSLLVVVLLCLGVFLEDFNRTPSPQFNFLFWLLFLLSFIGYLETKKKRYLVFSALFLGFLFHVYPYYWTFLVTTLFIFFAASFFWDPAFRVRPHIALIGGGLLIGSPYFVSLVKSMHAPYYAESIYRLGMIDTHFPSGIHIVFLSVIALALLVILERRRMLQRTPLFIFLISGLAGSIIVVNQHLITGKNLEFSSHYWMPAFFWWVFSLAYAGEQLLRAYDIKKRAMVYACAAFVSVPISLVYAAQVVAEQAIPDEGEVYAQRFAPVLEWLRNNTSPESVIYTHTELSELIPAYTHNNVFYTRNANLFFMPDRDVLERFIGATFFEKNFDEQFLLEHERFVWGAHFIDERGHARNKDRVLRFLGAEPAPATDRIPRDKIEEALAARDKIVAQGFEALFSRYRIDYVIQDMRENSGWGLERYPFLTPVARLGEFVVYAQRGQ